MNTNRTLAGMSLLVALALGVDNVAQAADVVLTPMVSNGADEKKVNNLFQLMSSELEFMPMVDSVKEANPRPASLNTGCLTNDSCLGRIASSNGGNALLTGVLTDQGATWVMDLVYFEGGRTQRRKAFNVPADATQIANNMTDMLNEMMTGTTPQAQAQANATPGDFSLDDDDDFFGGGSMAPAPAPAPMGGGFDGLVDAGPSPEELAYQQQQNAARARAEQEARMRAQQEAQRRAADEARRRQEEDARRRAEEEARRRQAEEARIRAEQEAQRRAAEDARRRQAEAARQEAARQEALRQEQARQAALEQERQRKAAENERRRQEEEARRRAAAAAQNSAPPANMGSINFANSSGQISAEDINSAIQFGSPTGSAPAPTQPAYNNTAYTPPPQPAYTPPAPQPTYTPPAPQPAYTPPAPQPTYNNGYGQPAANNGYGQPANNGYGQPANNGYGQPANNGYGQPAANNGYGQSNMFGNPQGDLALEEQELNGMNTGILDLDDEGKKGKRKDRGSTGSTATLDRATPKTMQFTVRAGYSRYFSFNFITAGAEVGVPLGKSLMAVAGLESYSVQRELPEAAQVPGQPIYQWNTIYPGNIGLVYKINTGMMVTPYVGADAIFVQYYKDDIGADWAGGARLRGGADILFVKNFGLNVNLAVGGWTGKNWTLIEPTVGNSGLLPQLNAGTVIAF